MDGGGGLARGHRTRLTASEGRRFGLTVGLALALLGAILWWRTHQIAAISVWSLAGALIVAAVVAPTRLGPVERAWMGMALAISKVTTPVFMSVVYFVVMTPVGLLRRAVSRNPLERDRARSSYWARHEPREPESLRRQF